MTCEELIAEGRKLAQSCVFLRANGSGPVAAVWYEGDDRETASTGHHRWLTVDAGQIPGLHSPVGGCISVLSKEEDFGNGSAIHNGNTSHATCLVRTARIPISGLTHF